MKKSFLSIILFFAALTVTGFGQTNRGGITGTVLDSSGAAIPGAAVTITNVGTNQKLLLKTSADGSYSAPTLDPVTYRIAVEAPGFKSAIVEEIKVDTASVSTVNITLQPGSVDTKITVEATAPVIEESSGVMGQVITEKQIQDIPLFNRSVLDLALTVPNVSGEVGTDDPQATTGQPQPGFGLNLNGGRAGSTAILADGANNTAIGFGRSVVSFSPDVVQEFSVQTSAYSAEYGQTGGGVINATTKSGTNRVTGTLNWYNRNPYFGAQPFTTASVNRPKNNLRQNQGGAIVGGPVWLPKIYDGRNRTFFFFAFEPRVYTDAIPIDGLLPTDAMRKGDFSDIVRVSNGLTTRQMANQFGIPITGDATIYQQFNLVGKQLQRINISGSQQYLPFPNNVIPAQFLDPTSQKILQYEPPVGPYFINGSNQLSNYASVRYVRNDEKRYTFKVDHNLTAANRLNVRMTRNPIDGVRIFGDPGSPAAKDQVNALQADENRSYQILLGDTHVFSPRVINDLRLNYTRGDYSRLNPPYWRTHNWSTDLGLPSITEAGLPGFSILENEWGNIGQHKIPSIGTTIENAYGISDTVAWSRGRSTIKFGTDLRNQRQAIQSLDYGQGPNYNFNTSLTNSGSGGTGGSQFATFLIGVPTSVQVRNAIIPYYYSWNSAAFFVQDDWKLKPNLTLNIGLRYSVQMPRTEKYNRQGVYLLDEAKSFPLPTPVTMPDGKVITTALVPPFAYSGIGGRSRGLTDTDWLNFEPRFGLAWSPHFARRLVIRGGYGISHVPITGMGNTAMPDFSVPSQTYNYNTGQVDPNYAMRLSSNPPLIVAQSPEQVLGIPADGRVWLNSINVPGFAVTKGFRVPYVQNWNVTLSYRLGGSSALEIAYVGSKGTHLFLPPSNVNVRPVDSIEAILGAGLDPDQNIADPLGRTSAGRVINVPRGSLTAPYLGFGRINQVLDPSANSNRHAGYVNFQRRFAKGLSFTGNYTYGKSIDDASDAGSAFVVLGPRTDGQGNLGNPRRLERSVSTFDMRHTYSATAIYQLPFGRGQRVARTAPQWLNAAVGDWQISGSARGNSGQPFAAFIRDSNGLYGTDDSVRMNLNPGVPLKNPLYSSSCPVGNACEPYFNPAAFIHSPVGELGNISRTLDGARSPGRRYLDASITKNFYPFGREKGRRVELRGDFINVLNHPNKYISPFNSRMYAGAINQSAVSAAEYDVWARANSQPLSNTAGGAAILAQVQALNTSNRIPGSTRLPADFFSVAVPNGFASINPNSFDIRTLNGYKLYRLRQQYSPDFGTLTGGGTNPRVIQLALRIYF